MYVNVKALKDGRSDIAVKGSCVVYEPKRCGQTDRNNSRGRDTHINERGNRTAEPRDNHT